MSIVSIPIKYRDEYIAITERINNAKTKSEHDRLEVYLRGFVDAGKLLGTPIGIIFMEADNHYDTDSPMCCGVYLDWEPPDA